MGLLRWAIRTPFGEAIGGREERKLSAFSSSVPCFLWGSACPVGSFMAPPLASSRTHHWSIWIWKWPSIQKLWVCGGSAQHSSDQRRLTHAGLVTVWSPVVWGESKRQIMWLRRSRFLSNTVAERYKKTFERGLNGQYDKMIDLLNYLYYRLIIQVICYSKSG